jgi:hypothetical protein
MSARWPRLLVFLAVLSCIPIGSAVATISNDPEPILGVGDGVSDSPELSEAGVISDTPDPISESACSSIMVISDGPDPISGIISHDPHPDFCVADGPEPVGASFDDDPYIVHPVVCRIGQSTVVVVWVAR